MTVVAAVLTVALVGCGGGADRASRTSRATATTSPAPTPAPSGTVPRAARARTVTGDRAGFAHGWELLRRDGDAAVTRDLDTMARTGARWLRVTVEWSHDELLRGEYRWGATDRVLRGALARGMSVLAVVTYAPPWSAVAGCDRDTCAPGDPEDYARFLAVAVARYAPLGVHAWEIWNEPNHAQFWGRPDPAAYTTLIRRAYATVKARDPGATVVSGGLAPVGDGPGEIAPLTFLRKVYELGGGASFDALGYHPYQYPDAPSTPDPRNGFLQTRALHELMLEHGDGTKPIWGTEMGVPTRGPGSVSEAEQADRLREAYDLWNSWPFTGPLLWFELRDTGDERTTEASFGLVRAEGDPKPGLSAFEAMVAAGALLPGAAGRSP